MERFLNIRTYPADSESEQHLSKRRRNIQTFGGKRTTCLPLLELLIWHRLHIYGSSLAHSVSTCLLQLFINK